MGNVVGQNTTYTGNPASFTGVAESVVSSVLVPIVPVQSGSGDPSPSNPRPISGLTSATVYHTGKNIWYEDIADWKVGYYINASGEETENSSYKYCQAYFPVFESTGYAVRYRKGTSSGYALTVCYYDSDKTFISIDTAISASSTTGVKTGTFTTPADCQYIRISCPRVNSTDIQIEVGSTSTDYEDSGSTYAADWTSSAGTVYGGTVDLVTGVLTVDKAIVDLGGLSWTMYAATGTSSGYAFYAEKSDSINRDTSRICSSYWVSDVVGLADTIAEYGITDKFSFASTNKRIFIVDSSYADADALKTGLNGVQMVYTLGTPMIYQLTPQVVSAVVGENHIWSNIDNVSVFLGNPIALVNSGAKSVIPTVTASAAMVLSWKNYTYSLEAGTSVIPQLVLESGTTNVYVDGTGTIKFEYAEASL